VFLNINLGKVKETVLIRVDIELLVIVEALVALKCLAHRVELKSKLINNLIQKQSKN